MTENAEQIDLTRIHGFSDKVHWPRVGKVRLGYRNQKGFPVQADYFVFDDTTLEDFPQIGEVFADRKTGEIAPKSLDVVLVSDDVRQVFPQSWRFYGKSKGLRCIGNGRRALRYVCRKCKTFNCGCETPEVDRVEVPCTCELAESGKCVKTGLLHFLLPQITMEGVFQLAVRNTTIPRINSGLALVRAMLGRIALVPLKLRRVPVRQQAHGKTYTNFLVSIGYAGGLEQAQQLREAKGTDVAGFLAAPEAEETEEDVLDGELETGELETGKLETKETGAASEEKQGTFTEGVDGYGEAPWDETGELETGEPETRETDSAAENPSTSLRAGKLSKDRRDAGEKFVNEFGHPRTGRPSTLRAILMKLKIPENTQVALLSDEELIAVAKAIEEYERKG